MIDIGGWDALSRIDHSPGEAMEGVLVEAWPLLCECDVTSWRERGDRCRRALRTTPIECCMNGGAAEFLDYLEVVQEFCRTPYRAIYVRHPQSASGRSDLPRPLEAKN